MLSNINLRTNNTARPYTFAAYYQTIEFLIPSIKILKIKQNQSLFSPGKVNIILFNV